MSIESTHRHQWLRAGLLACGLAVSATVPAQTLDFGSCVRIEDLSARLACYDRAAGRTPSAGAVAPATVTRPAAPAPAVAPAPPAAVQVAPVRPAPAPAVTPAMPSDPVASFGAVGSGPDPLTAKKTQPETTEVKKIEARVTAVRTRPAGEQVLTLDNGQVWTQTETRRDPQFAVGDVVVIRRGVLGSFMLNLQKGSSTTRVKRIS